MKFPKEDLRELVFGGDISGYKMIRRPEITDQDRWATYQDFIFQAPDGKLYRGEYSHGSTESQDHCAFEYEDDPLECEEVQPVEKVVIVYEKVNSAENSSSDPRGIF